MNDHWLSTIAFLFHQCTTLCVAAYTLRSSVSTVSAPVTVPTNVPVLGTVDGSVTVPTKRITLEKLRSVISVLLDLSKLLDRGLAFSRGVAIA